jgi:hypothetical protein
MNLFVGLVLKAAPGSEATVFQAVYLLLGFGFYSSVFALMRLLGVSRGIGLAISTLLMMSPSFILFEHQLVYDWPVACLLTISGVLLARSLRTLRLVPLLLFFSCVALLCFTRSIFHLVFFLMAFFLVLSGRWQERRVIVLAAVVPFLLITTLYAKNYFVFGKFSSGTGVGGNVAKVLTRSTPLEERRRWVDAGLVSQLFLSDPAPPVADLPGLYQHVSGYEDIPALRNTLKRDGKSTNYNHLAYIAVHDQYFNDALTVMRHYPARELFGLLSAGYCYFRSTSDWVILETNRSKMMPLIAFYDHMLYGELPWELPYGKGYKIYLFLLAGLPFLLVYGIRVGRRSAVGERRLDPSARDLVRFMCLTTLYVFLCTTTMELAENQRGNFCTIGFTTVLLGVLTQHIADRWSARGRVRNSDSRLLRDGTVEQSRG